MVPTSALHRTAQFKVICISVRLAGAPCHEHHQLHQTGIIHSHGAWQELHMTQVGQAGHERRKCPEVISLQQVSASAVVQ